MTVTFIGDADVLDWLRSAAEDPAMEFWKFTVETAIDDIERYRADLHRGANRIAELEAALRAMFDQYEGIYDMALPHPHQSDAAKRSEQLARDALKT